METAKTKKDAAAVIAAAARPVNRFAAHFPIANMTFSDVSENEGKAWSDGTIPRTVSNVIMQLGDTGMILSARIQHLRYKDGRQQFDLMMPSTSMAQGKIHIPVLNPLRGTDTAVAWDEYRKDVVNKWKADRIAAVKAGAKTITASVASRGVTVDDDEMLALGLAAAPEPPKTTDPATTT